MRSIIVTLTAIIIYTLTTGIPHAEDIKKVAISSGSVILKPPLEKYQPYWLVTGNANTDSAASDFLGTSDDKPFVIKTNNMERIRINKYDSVKIGLINLSSFHGNLKNRKAVIHFLQDNEVESASNVNILNSVPGQLSIGGKAALPADRIRLQVYGMIKSTEGFSFPDGTVQKTAEIKGDNGTNGVNGVDGKNGTNGTNGVDGRNGTNGTNGVNGKNGVDGAKGDKGDSAGIWCVGNNGTTCNCGTSNQIAIQISAANLVTTVSVTTPNGKTCSGSTIQVGVAPNASYLSGSACVCEIK